MKKEMLINVLQAEECRIAIVEDGQLEELYVERASQESYVGNIYKGRVVNIEASIQAVFVDFGIGRNGFLHVSDVDPVYYKHLLPKHIRDEMDAEAGGRPPAAGRGGPPDRGNDRDRGPARGGDHGDRDRRDDRDRGPRPPRVTEPESAVTVARPAPRAEAPPADDFEDDAAAGFGTGLLDDDAPEPARPAVAHRPERPQAEAARPAAPVPPPPAARAPAPQPARQSTEVDDEFSDFGAGLDLADEAPAAQPAPHQPDQPAAEQGGWEVGTSDGPTAADDLVELKPAAADVGTPALAEPVEAGVPVAEADEEKPAAEPKAKGRGRAKAKPKAKADEVTVEGDEAAKEPDAEAKPKAKPRRTRKKADGDAETTDGPDDKPRPMAGAERRTTGDEPEIRPFFEGGAADDFDPDAPNDRFAAGPAPRRAPAPARPAGDVDGEEDAVVFEENAEVVEIEVGDPVAAEEEEDFAPVGAADDDEDFGPGPVRVSRDDEDGGGGRGRGRDRGRRPRGGPGGDRGGPGGPGGGRGGPMGGRSGPPARDRGFPRPPIQEIFKRGQEVIVQVIKEGIGTKGPTLSTFVSIAGRYLVLMPSLGRVGVSRKIEDMDARRRLRDTMTKLNPPRGVGFIVRTAAIDRNEKELQNDLAYLLRLWQVVVRRIKKMPAPVEIYRESDMITRTIRDIFTNDIDTIYVDEPNAFAHASEFLQIVMPRFAARIKFHDETEPLFHKYRVEDEIARLNHKRIDLPQGGSIIIEQTEALVAIDVNSGTFRAENNAEETAYQMNLLAAREIARQLRLRDLGGVIVNDFIDMRGEAHRRNVENALENALKRDRARTKVLRISQFGIIEMTRQRIQPSLKKRVYNDCPHCRGTGYVKTDETMGIEVMRLLQLAAHRSPAITAVTLTVHPDAALYLLNRKRREIAALEERAKMEVQVNGQPGASPDLLEFRCFDSNGNEVRLFAAGPPPRLFRGPAPRVPDRRPPQLD